MCRSYVTTQGKRDVIVDVDYLYQAKQLRIDWVVCSPPYAPTHSLAVRWPCAGRVLTLRWDVFHTFIRVCVCE